METEQFSKNACDWCRTSKLRPDQKSIKVAFTLARKKPVEKGNAIIIARYQWLISHKLTIPQDMLLPNLCIIVKEGKLRRAFYSDTLTDIIKKQRYNIQILN